MGAPNLSQHYDQSAVEILRQCFLFANTDDETLIHIASLLEELFYKKGDPIILENEISDHVYFIKSGAVEIVSYIPELKQVNRLAILRAGDHFSEFSVLNRSPKSGSAFALEDCHFLRINGDHFMGVLRAFPEVTENLVVNLARLNRNLIEAHTFIEYFREDLIQLKSDVLNLLPQPTWQRFGVLPLAFEGAVLTVALKNPYNIEFFEFLKKQAPKVRVNVYLISESDFKGTELILKEALLTNDVSFLRSHQKAEVEPDVAELTDLIKVNHLFGNLPTHIQNQLAPHFEAWQFQAGDEIFSPAQESEHLYLIQKGRVEISHPLKDSPAHTHIVTLGPNQSFSELSLLAGSPHRHLAKAMDTCHVFKLKKEILLELVKTVEFSIPLAQVLAARLKSLNHLVGHEYFKPDKRLDFAGLEKLLPLSVIEEYRLLPLRLQESELTLGIVSPDSEEIYSLAARYLMNYRINLQMISDHDFSQWFSELKAATLQQGSLKPAHTPKYQTNIKAVNPTQIVDVILQEGLDGRASDIHLDPGVDSMSVRFRVDGILREWDRKIPSAQASEVINRIKVLANMDISNNRIPQDGQLKTVVHDLPVASRVSTLPTKRGEKAVLRIIREHHSVVPLNMLAPDQRVIKILRAVAQARQGLFLVTGPTGSGKSTTLYSMLNELNSVGINVVTLEDPVEMDIPGLTQVEIHKKSGLTFPLALRSVLRQDPDVIMVGEIRDEESARIVFEAAITGHLVLSTLHTNHSLDFTERLKDLGISSATMGAGLLGVTSQRLVRASCKQCVELRPTTSFEKQLFIDHLNMSAPPDVVSESRGCARCNHSGYLGRIPLFEVWRSTEPMKLCVSKDSEWSQLEEIAREDGFEKLYEFGLKMVLSGLTTFDEIKRCLASV